MSTHYLQPSKWNQMHICNQSKPHFPTSLHHSSFQYESIPTCFTLDTHFTWKPPSSSASDSTPARVKSHFGESLEDKLIRRRSFYRHFRSLEREDETTRLSYYMAAVKPDPRDRGKRGYNYEATAARGALRTWTRLREATQKRCVWRLYYGHAVAAGAVVIWDPYIIRLKVLLVSLAIVGFILVEI